MDAPHLFPVSLNLQHKRCLVVGGGAVAERRVRSLLACRAVVHLVSPEVTSGLAQLARQGAIQWTQETFQPAHLHEMAVVLVATNNPRTNAQIASLARQQHCLVNIADDPVHCDFYLPAVVRRGHLTLAISTEGHAPAFTAWLRKQLERLLDPRLSHIVARYAALRPEMQQRYPDLQARAQAWEQLLAAEVPALFPPPAPAEDDS
jgi:precorrin-2 dehydrogenase/sirohydrochlorin ferrochelatase